MAWVAGSSLIIREITVRGLRRASATVGPRVAKSVIIITRTRGRQTDQFNGKGPEQPWALRHSRWAFPLQVLKRQRAAPSDSTSSAQTGGSAAGDTGRTVTEAGRRGAEIARFGRSPTGGKSGVSQCRANGDRSPNPPVRQTARWTVRCGDARR